MRWGGSKHGCGAAIVLAVAALAPAAYGNNGSGRLATITGIRELQAAKGERVIIELERNVEVRQGCLTGPARIYLDFHQARMPRALRIRRPPEKQRKVRRLRVGQHAPDTVRAVLEVQGVARYTAYKSGTPARVIIELMPGGRRASPCRHGARERAVKIADVPLVVIDPGHGGQDKGARGVAGNSEAQVALAVGKRLAALLRKRGEAEVLLTRKDDRFLSLAQRTTTATRREADVFVSLHAAAGPAAAECGPRAYYLALTTSATALRLASRENAGNDSTVHELSALVAAIMRDRHTEESHHLAQSIARAFSPKRSGRKRREAEAGRAPLTVLMGLDSPGVVVRLGCLKRRAEGRRLRTGKYQAKLAQALYAGISDFLREKRRREMATSPKRLTHRE